MDTTTLQATITNLEGQESSLSQQLSDTQNQLTVAKNELANANVINALEALDADQLTALNAALAADSQNTNGISVAGNFPQPGV